ncbi:MAG: ADP-ribosylation factor-like protein [Candidatus Hodarchaeota archaeon]
MDNNENEEQPIKLVIMGMENAGKTTILDVLTQKINHPPNKPPSMNPTKSVERSTLLFFQKETKVWDFGGQESYRNEYLAHPEKYFQTISFFYYVVDIQDYYRLIQSVMYFQGVFNLIKKFSPEAKIIFLFHKMDPDYSPDERNLKGIFLEKVEPDLKLNNTPYTMFDTTIFDLNSIKTAFGLETL